MRIKFNYFEKQKELCLKKVNVFYGYNNSGKTRLAKIIQNGFLQKNKGLFLVDGYQLLKNQYEVVYLDSKETIEDHIKLNTKSILKKLYFDKIINTLDEDSKFSSYICEKFKDTNNKIINIFENINVGDERLQMQLSLESIEDLIISCIQIIFTSEHLSSSNSKMLLYNSLIEYNNIYPQKKIIIIDDFDIYLDEKNTMELLEKLQKDTMNTYLLFTSKSTSLPYLMNMGGMFNVRENKIIDITNIEKIIRYVLASEKQNYSFEEFVVSGELLVLDDEIKEGVEEIKKYIKLNLGKMLVNENYELNSNNKGISIISNNEFENKLLIYIDQIIKSSR